MREKTRILCFAVYIVATSYLAILIASKAKPGK